MSKGTWLPPSTNVKFPRGSLIFGNSMSRQPRSSPPRSAPDLKLIVVVGSSACSITFLVVDEPDVEVATGALGRDAEIEPRLAGIDLLEQHLQDGIERGQLLALLGGSDVLSMGYLIAFIHQHAAEQFAAPVSTEQMD